MKNLQLIEYYRNHITEMNRPNPLHPAEEEQARIFLDAIESLDTPIPSMIEIGCSSHSAFSQNFSDIFENECINICTEIIEKDIQLFEKEWKENSRIGFFYHGYCGTPVHIGEPPSTNQSRGKHLKIKELMQKHNIDILDILHMDIQGSEVSVLAELEEDNLFDRIRYGIVSLHGTHSQCKKILDKQNLEYLYDSPNSGGYGPDGLIIFHNTSI